MTWYPNEWLGELYHSQVVWGVWRAQRKLRGKCGPRALRKER